MPIRWKVTTKKRKSAVVSVLADRYSLRYTKNKLVKAHENSLGIAVFETKKQATVWRNWKARGGLVLKVDAKGRGVRPKEKMPCVWGSWSIEESLHRIKRFGLAWLLRTTTNGWHVPEGTLLYKEVEVLE